MEDLIIDPGEWRSLTPFQKHRVAVLKDQPTIAAIKSIIEAFGVPFKDGHTTIKSRIEFGEQVVLIVHAQWRKQ